MMRITVRSRHWLVVLALAACVALAAAGGATSKTGKPDTPTSAKIDALRDAALRIARENGEPAPSAGSVVQTNRKALTAMFGAELPFEEAVYAVVLHGQFTSTRPRPYGKPAPTGTVLTLAFDASTLQMKDFMLSRTAPDLSKLGTVAPLGL